MCRLRKDRVLPLTISPLSRSPFYTAIILKYVLSNSPRCFTTHFISTERLPSCHAIGGSSPRFHPSFHHHLYHRLPLLCVHLRDGAVYL